MLRRQLLGKKKFFTEADHQVTSDHAFLQSVVVVESSMQTELLRGDVIVSVDGRKVTQVGQVPKLMRSAAIQVTVRVERRAPDATPDICPRKPSASEGDSSGSSSISGTYLTLVSKIPIYRIMLVSSIH